MSFQITVNPGTLEEQSEMFDVQLMDELLQADIEKAEEEFGPGNIWVYQTEMDDDVCAECKGYNGNIYTSKEVAEKWAWAEKLRAMIKPNVHPNCRCRLETLVTVEVI